LRQQWVVPKDKLDNDQQKGSKMGTLARTESVEPPAECPQEEVIARGEQSETDDDEEMDGFGKILSRQLLWRGLGIATILLGVGCIILSMNLRDQTRNQRRWTRRH